MSNTPKQLAEALQRGHESGSQGFSHNHAGKHVCPYVKDTMSEDDTELYKAWCVGFDRASRNAQG